MKHRKSENHTTSNRHAFSRFGQSKHDACLRTSRKVREILGIETEGCCLVFDVPWMGSTLDTGGAYLGNLVFATVTEITPKGPVSKVLLETDDGWRHVTNEDIADILI
jgi:hypothetical protein